MQHKGLIVYNIDIKLENYVSSLTTDNYVPPLLTF